MLSINPMVSVLMTAYNAEKYIGAAIESILSQTYKNFQFIIVNDASTDKTQSIINKYADLDKRICVLNLKKNLGPAEAANKGLSKVSGEYLFRMDSDDISEADRLEKQVNYLEKNPEVSMLGGQCTLIDGSGKRIGQKLFPTDHKSIFESLFSRNPIQHPACVINLQRMSKRAMLSDGKSVLAHDLELVFLASQYGKLANLDEFILKYRQSPGSFSLKNPKKTFLATLIVRLESVLKYGYRPSLKGILMTLAQTVFVAVIPNSYIYPIYSYFRGMRRIVLKSVKIEFDANLKKNVGLAKA